MPRGIGQLTSLENLSAFMVAKDNGVSKHSGRLGELRDLNNLRDVLRIMNLCSCPNLTSTPLIPSVQHLVLKNASKKSLKDILKMKISVHPFLFFDFPSQLKILQIENIEDLEFLPEELLTNLTSLQQLYIRYCPRITKVSSAFRHLTSLEHLVILACEELDLSDSEDHSDMRWQYLRRLRVLQLVNLNKLASIPKGLQHVPTLRKLTIQNCPNLISLLEWMGSLTALWIEECPQLLERCKSNICVDWPKIAHIPNISIDDRWIQVNGCYKL
ncbi:hypothetical protein GH714_016659 [Hevea brasiliensis]|uniref:Disease resistance protein At4g27190-like leucine-rich repeats domain-containing protein n=1 Tax=Hevea brasiliensis TaxID=3981 RepID=A0A6A6N2F1_HEVBR|nr:hypothetical protein GH714_016659 [Hevea brasiliensis]